MSVGGADQRVVLIVMAIRIVMLNHFEGGGRWRTTVVDAVTVVEGDSRR